MRKSIRILRRSAQRNLDRLRESLKTLVKEDAVRISEELQIFAQELSHLEFSLRRKHLGLAIELYEIERRLMGISIYLIAEVRMTFEKGVQELLPVLDSLDELLLSLKKPLLNLLFQRFYCFFNSHDLVLGIDPTSNERVHACTRFNCCYSRKTDWVERNSEKRKNDSKELYCST